MPTTETISSNYAGQVAQSFMSAALLSAESIDNGAVSAQPNVKYKWNIPRVDLSSIVQDATCDFTPGGTVTRSERVLTVENFEVNLKLCKASYRDTFEAEQMGFSAHDQLAPSFADYLIDLAAANVAASRETTIWQGSAGTTGQFDGFETLFASNALQPSGLEVAGTTVTASNVIAEITKVLDAAPVALYKKPGFAILIPTNIMRHYIAAQAALGYLDKFYVDKTEMNFLGVPLIECPGMSDDKMVATYSGNLYYGIGNVGDWTRVDLIDQSPLDGSDNVHLVMKWADGIQYGIGEDIVTYGITNSAN